ncbi:MAG TPA: EAL domain-containing protein [Acidimicrobiales bacterium]|nr:EAL domain-containing protein [Acidimicrobiales bacterium]
MVGLSLLLAASAAVVAPLTPQGGSARAPFHVAWYLLAAGFAFTEAFCVHIEVGENAHSLLLNELPLVLGLFCCRPWEVLLARVVGGTAVQLWRHRSAPLKLLYNPGLYVMEASVACLVFRLLGGTGHSITGSSLAALAATATTGVLGGLSTATAISLSGGPPLRRVASRMMVTATVAPLATTCLGLAGVELLIVDRTSAWLIAVIGGVLFLAYRSYASLSQRYANLQQLYDFTRVLNGSPEMEGAVRATLDQACDVMRAARAELHLDPGDGSLPLRVAMVDGHIEPITEPADEAGDDPVVALVSGLERPIVIGRSTRDATGRACLSRRGAKDMVVAPLTHGGRTVGALAVLDRLGTVSTFDDEDAKVFATLANHAGVSIDNARLIDRLRVEAAEKDHQALHDSLTGLGNRNLFSRRTDEALNAAGVGATSLAVMLLDLNRFKDINDTLGHHCGDLVLQEVARRLRAALPRTAVITRLGGDEFAVLLPGVGEPEAELAGIAIVEQLARPFVMGDLELAIAAAVGVALAPQHGADAASLLQHADIAMYRAKEAHDNDVVIYRSEDDLNSTRRLTVAAQIRHAIDREQLSVVYQPKAELATGRVVGAEALLRWNHPELGPIPPDEFIPVAENVGHIQALTTYVLNAALRQCRAWHDAGITIGVAVNLSSRSLVDLSLPEEVGAALAAVGLPPSVLTLEITESQLMIDTVRTLRVLDDLHDLGVKISLDDFGTGYSSLSYLNRLPVNELKIDKTFVMRLGDNPHDTAIVRSVIDLARNLRLEVVAEGVEVPAAWELLRGLGCDVAQGYLLSRPQPPADLTEWMVNRQASRPA